jgi:hypothetical protein
MHRADDTQQRPWLKPPEASCSAGDWVSLQLRRETLERYVARESRVLELNAGEGYFTDVLRQMGCRISLAEESPDGLGSTGASLADFAADAYDAVVAYNGTLSYAMHRRDQVLAECRRVLRADGLLILDVLSLWGTLHRQLPIVVGRDLVHNRGVIRTGDVPGVNRHCHLFRAAELESFLCSGGFELMKLSASSVLSTGIDVPVSSDASIWSALLEYERSASIERGCLDGGSRLIAVARRTR